MFDSFITLATAQSDLVVALANMPILDFNALKTELHNALGENGYKQLKVIAAVTTMFQERALKQLKDFDLGEVTDETACTHVVAAITQVSLTAISRKRTDPVTSSSECLPAKRKVHQTHFYSPADYHYSHPKKKRKSSSTTTTGTPTKKSKLDEEEEEEFDDTIDDIKEQQKKQQQQNKQKPTDDEEGYFYLSSSGVNNKSEEKETQKQDADERNGTPEATTSGVNKNNEEEKTQKQDRDERNGTPKEATTSSGVNKNNEEEETQKQDAKDTIIDITNDTEEEIEDANVLKHLQEWYNAADNHLVSTSIVLNPLITVDILKACVPILRMGKRMKLNKETVRQQITNELRDSLACNLIILDNNKNNHWIKQYYTTTPPDGFCSHHIMHQLFKNWNYFKTNKSFMNSQDLADQRLPRNADDCAKILQAGLQGLNRHRHINNGFDLSHLKGTLKNVLQAIAPGGPLRNSKDECPANSSDTHFTWGNVEDSGYLFLHENNVPFIQFIATADNSNGKHSSKLSIC